MIPEVDWFADEGLTMLGVVLYDRTDDDWGFVILGRNSSGSFEGIDCRINVPDRKSARADLVVAMEKLETSEQPLFN
jgi:hypothetical protein